MLSGSGYAHLTKVSKCPVRSAVGAGSERPQGSLHEDSEAAQAPQPSPGPRVSFAARGADVGSVRSRRMRKRTTVIPCLSLR